MRNGLTKLAAAVFVIAVLVGAFQLDGARAVFARTTRVVSTGLAGLKEFVIGMSAREAAPPSPVVPAEPVRMSSDAQGKHILAKVRVFSAIGGQKNLQGFLEAEGIEFAPAGNDPSTSYARLDPGKPQRFVEFAGDSDDLALTSLPSLTLIEGQEGVIGGISSGEAQAATALALVAAVSDDNESIELSLSFLRGQTGFEMPSLTTRIDEALLFRLVSTEEIGGDEDVENVIFVLVLVKVLPATQRIRSG